MRRARTSSTGAKAPWHPCGIFGGSQVGRYLAPRTPAQDKVLSGRVAHRFPPIRRDIRIRRSETTRPFPHIARHIQRTVATGPGEGLPNRCGLLDDGLPTRGALRLPKVAPRIDPPVRASGRIFPLGFRWEAKVEAGVGAAVSAVVRCATPSPQRPNRLGSCTHHLRLA